VSVSPSFACVGRLGEEKKVKTSSFTSYLERGLDRISPTNLSQQNSQQFPTSFDPTKSEKRGKSVKERRRRKKKKKL